MMNMLMAALHYAELGYPVFPCAPGGKTPITKHGFKDASTDPERIEAWWKRHPNANIGIPTAGLLVVDIDGGGNPWLAGDPGKCEDLARGALSLTPGGGRHHVFRQPKDRSWSNTTGKLAPKVDTRANGGYIVAPPSVIDGKVYCWAETLELDAPLDSLPEPPGWLTDLLDGNNGGLLALTPQSSPESPPVTPPNAPCSPQGEDSDANGNMIPSGQRNATLARLAGTMRRVGMGYAEVRAALVQSNADRCKPPLGMREVDRIAASICRYEPDQVAVAVVEDHWTQTVAEPAQAGTSDPAPPLPDPGPLPDELLRVPGFVAEVMDYCLETAPYPNMVMAFCGALSLQAFLAGRKVRDPGDNRTNIYLLGLAHSAAGKDWPRKVNTRIAHEAGLAGGLGDRFASGEGVQDALFINPCMLFQTDEIDGMLQQINKAQDARHENVMGTLLTMYSSANSVFSMRRKAGKESPGSIDQPCLTIFGTAIPNHYYGALSERMLTNGFFARMIILEGGKRSKGQEPTIRNPPERVIEAAKWWADYHPGTGNLENWHPVPTVIEHDDDAKRILVETREEAEAEYGRSEARSDPVGTTVWGRVSEQTRKLALIHAVSENRESPSIGKAAAEWASRFVMHQTRRMLFMAQSFVADNPFHAECLKAVEKLRSAPGNELPHSVLLKRMKMDSKSFTVLIETLIQQGDVEIAQTSQSGHGGRPTLAYRLAGRGGMA
jgi:hypothetical protein